MEPDHHDMLPPSLRIAKSFCFEKKTTIYVWDFRISQPNVSYIPDNALHSLEHFLNVFLLEETPKVINVAPLGCQTGLYIVVADLSNFSMLASLLVRVLERILLADAVPLANEKECGWAENHSLKGAQNLAAWLLSRKREWHIITEIKL